MNNIKNLTGTIQKKNKSLRSKIDKNIPQMKNIIFFNLIVFVGHEHPLYDWYCI